MPDLAADADREPLPSHPAVDGTVIVCAACGQENVAGTDKCVGPACKKTLKGNGLSRKTDLYTTNLTPALRAIEEAGRALVEQSITDAGGREELIARALSVHEYRGLLHVRILKLEHALNVLGDFDRRGRLRLGWLKQLESYVTTALSIDRTLGLDRKAKHVDLAQAFAAQERGENRG